MRPYRHGGQQAAIRLSRLEDQKIRPRIKALFFQEITEALPAEMEFSLIFLSGPRSRGPSTYKDDGFSENLSFYFCTASILHCRINSRLWGDCAGL
jgi:hypothetical protein